MTRIAGNLLTPSACCPVCKKTCYPCKQCICDIKCYSCEGTDCSVTFNYGSCGCIDQPFVESQDDVNQHLAAVVTLSGSVSSGPGSYPACVDGPFPCAPIDGSFVCPCGQSIYGRKTALYCRTGNSAPSQTAIMSCYGIEINHVTPGTVDCFVKTATVGCFDNDIDNCIEDWNLGGGTCSSLGFGQWHCIYNRRQIGNYQYVPDQHVNCPAGCNPTQQVLQCQYGETAWDTADYFAGPSDACDISQIDIKLEFQ